MSDTTIIEFLEDRYAQLKGGRRELKANDHLILDLDLDSVDVVEIFVDMEDRFGVDLTENEQAAQVQTVGEVVNLVQDLRAVA
jgi:acyl carrier protein